MVIFHGRDKMGKKTVKVPWQVVPFWDGYCPVQSLERSKICDFQELISFQHMFLKLPPNQNTKVPEWRNCFFTCATSRALHLELTPDLSSEAFIRCLRRFTARRGTPASITSHNPKTFKEANKDLVQLFQDKKTQDYAANHGIAWHFILEKAPSGGILRAHGTASKEEPLQSLRKGTADIGRTPHCSDRSRGSATLMTSCVHLPMGNRKHGFRLNKYYIYLKYSFFLNFFTTFTVLRTTYSAYKVTILTVFAILRIFHFPYNIYSAYKSTHTFNGEKEATKIDE